MIIIKLKFAQLTRDSFGWIDRPAVILQKPHGEVIGPLGHAFALELDLKFNETSQVRFSYPKRDHGKDTPFYDELVGKLVQIAPFGTFLL